MKAFIIDVFEWLILQTDNDLDDKILAKVKDGMKFDVVWWIFLEIFNEGLKIIACNTFMVLFRGHTIHDWKNWN